MNIVINDGHTGGFHSFVSLRELNVTVSDTTAGVREASTRCISGCSLSMAEWSAEVPG